MSGEGRVTIKRYGSASPDPMSTMGVFNEADVAALEREVAELREERNKHRARATCVLGSHYMGQEPVHDALDRLLALRAALRERVIVHTVSDERIEPSQPGRLEQARTAGLVMTCELCKGRWPIGQPEAHGADCLAK